MAVDKTEAPVMKAENFDPKAVNQLLLSKILNLTVQSIRNYENGTFDDSIGPFPSGKREGAKEKLYNIHSVLEWYIRYCAFTKLSDMVKGTSSDEMTYEQARTKKEVVNYKIQQLEYDKQLGNLLPKDEVKKSWSNAFTFVKGRLLNLPIRLASLPLDGKNIPEKASIIDGDIREVLLELSEMDTSINE